MLFFGKSKAAKELEEVLKSLMLAFENNYKDNARDNLKKFEKMYTEAVAENKLRPKEKETYGNMLESLKERLKDFHH